MSTAIDHTIALPSGYTVVDRLGAGGYGEVWKATAPGGVEKAIKIVFGHCDEAMAERELKSLERIKRVRHPFVLSIERYEIVSNRLIIVTELADMSLSDCFQKHVAAGQSGIPRDNLIAYLWDAAEALDYLVEQHSLQHLDIKPENLLVVGDHIKVADFGLVKELASKTLNSMMGGMTPLYSAPEIYDNNPSSRSDQYSLAIVYQHMLTGTLPFSGRTPAQLAKQHTLVDPNLNTLCPADMPIVRKALAKEPGARFANCREFVGALRLATQASAAVAKGFSDGAGSTTSNSSDDTKSISLLDTTHLEDPVSAAATQILGLAANADSAEVHSLRTSASVRARPRVDPTIHDIEVPAVNNTTAIAPAPTLFVGVGGVGIRMLRAIRERADRDRRDDDAPLAWLAIDTDRETLKTVSDEGVCLLSDDEKLHIPLRRPNQYRDGSQALLQWVSRRWLYNIPRSLQTRGFRPLGRIALVDHSASVFSTLQQRLHWLVTQAPSSTAESQPLRVVVLTGLSGGTGSGTFIDIAQAVRSICHEHSQEVHVRALFASTFHPESTDSLAAANMYSVLTELNHAQLKGNQGENPPPGPASRYESARHPFDEIYTVAFPPRSDRTNCEFTLQSIADYAILEANRQAGPALAALRVPSGSPPSSNSLRTFNCVNIGRLANRFIGQHKQHLTRAIIAHWQEENSENSDPDARYFCHHAHSRFAQAVLANFPRPPVCEHHSSDDPAPEPVDRARPARIKNIATAYAQVVEALHSEPANDQGAATGVADVTFASNRIISKICEIPHVHDIDVNELAVKVSETLTEQVKELTESSSATDCARLAETALALTNTTLLDCGLQRRTMLVSPTDCPHTELFAALSRACPTTANYSMEGLAETLLLREGSGLYPLYLGARLAEIHPDIHEAAGRLHSRSDIQWLDLFSP